MRQFYLLLSAMLCFGIASSQTTIYSNNFSGGSTGWTLGSSGLTDAWIVNSIYNCSTPTPNNNGGNYLHIYDDFNGESCSMAYFGTGGANTINADMTSGFNTTGYDTIRISFSWLCLGINAFWESYGTVWFSVNGGANWTQVTNPRTKFNGQSNWTSTTITSTAYPALLNKSDVRLRFQWVNSALGANPAFAVDDILVTGSGTACSNAGGITDANPSTICSGQTANLVLSAYAGTIQWQQSPDGLSQWANVTGGTGATTANYTTAALSTNTHYRAVLSQSGCPDEFSAISTITVFPQVSPTISISVSQLDSVCSGDTLLFSSLIGNGGTSPAYQWKVNAQDVSTASSYASSTLQNGDVVTCILTNPSLCAIPQSDTSNPIVAKIKANVTPAINITGPSTVCEGETPTYTAYISNGGTTPVYNWQQNTLSAGSGSTFTPVSLQAGDSITCTLTSNAQCAVPETLTSQSIKITIAANPDTIITVNGTTEICENDSVVLVAEAGHTYLWSTGATTGSITVKATAVYNVTITGTNNCTAISEEVDVAVHSLPTPTITLTADTFTSSAAVSYQWYFNDTAISNATSQTHIAAQTGFYSVEVTDANGCKNKSVQSYFLITGVDELNGNRVRVYPNPSVGSWQLRVGPEFVGSNISVADANGRILFQSQLRNVNSEINLDAMPGIYFLQVNSIKGNCTHKLVKL